MVWLKINMNDKNKSTINQLVEPRLIKRLRIYILIMLIMLVLVTYEVLIGKFSVQMAINGILIGLGIGLIVGRVYRLSWDEDTSNVIGQIDWIGAIILAIYLIFVFSRAYVLGHWIQGTSLLALILSLTAGTMLGRVISTRYGVKKVLNALKLDKLPLPI